jgi:methylenetetrahydrofolate reductase (NADPH)
LNAPHLHSDAKSQLMANPSAAFLCKLSIEITPKQIDKLPLLQERLPKGTPIFIALIDPAEVDNQLKAASLLRKGGLEPIPHVPARFIIDETDLKSRVAALAGEAGVTTMLVLGGGAPTPMGKFDAAIQLLRTDVFQANGVKRIGIAGHPEGNPDITKIHGEAALLNALGEKQAFLKTNGIAGFVATQFLFEAGPVAYWVSMLRNNGIDLPVHVGIPGPATIKTLVKYAAMCGVGNSARFIRKQALNITKLLTVNTPDEFIEQLAVLHIDRPELGIAGPHLYPFGGFDRMFEWLTPKLKG